MKSLTSTEGGDEKGMLFYVEDVSCKLFSSTKRLRGLTPEDRLIYQMIKRSSTTGIWLRHLKTKSNIAASKVMRILGVLERRKLVKVERMLFFFFPTLMFLLIQAVKTAEGGKKRVYMLFDLNPPAKLDYNPEKMSKLTSLTLEYLVKKVRFGQNCCASINFRE